MIRYSHGNILICDAEMADVDALKNNLRREDAEEVLASDGDIRTALALSVENSVAAFSVRIDNNIVALFGVRPDSMLGSTARIWFIGAPEMSRIKKSFVKISREVVKLWLQKYSVLWNCVDGRYKSTFLWLKSMGAKFEETPIMFSGIPFYLFTIRQAVGRF